MYFFNCLQTRTPYLVPELCQKEVSLVHRGEVCSAFVSVCTLYAHFKCPNDEVGMYLFFLGQSLVGQTALFQKHAT